MEASYRNAFLKSDASQAIFVIAVSNLASLTLIRSDYESFGNSATFNEFFAARIGVFIVSCIAIYILARSPHPKWHDAAVTGYMIAGALINLFINSMTNAGYAAFIGVSIILLNIYYFVFFSPILIRTIISCLFSAAIIYQAYQSPLDAESKSVIVGMHLLTNLIGAVVSTKLYHHRRDSYRTQIEGKEMQTELDKLASTDPLTGIWNRRKFTANAIDEFECAKQNKRALSLILIDIDNLKNINDTHGHLAGDEVIKHCAQIMTMRIREKDVLGRLGGDEFGILLSDTQLSAAVMVGKRIQDLDRKTHINLNGEEVYITLSLGLAEFTETDRTFDDIFARADQKLYLAKQDGRDAIKFS